MIHVTMVNMTNFVINILSWYLEVNTVYQNDFIVHFIWVNFIACELYVNKTVFGK